MADTFEASCSDLRVHLTQLINEVLKKGNRVCITAHGEPVAGLVPVADLERLEGKTDGKKRADKKSKK